MSILRDDLVKSTNDFFSLHWPAEEPEPTWCEPAWTGIDSVPHFDLQGCYALLRENRITYIGSAFGRGSSLRRGFGISSRLASYYVRRDRSAIRTDGLPVYTFLHGYTAAYTIGFRSYAYLAIALEHFLIGRFAADLPDNKIAIFKTSNAQSAADPLYTAIENNFHDLVRQRMKTLIQTPPQLQFPKLDQTTSSLREAPTWFEVEGMYGGFSYWFDHTGKEPKLVCESWCRVVGGSGERHVIDANGCTLVEQGFV